MTRVTVLVAVYNTENYLRRCLDSLLSQTMAGWQAECVDDGSTDGSAAILDDYAVKDSRIRVTHLTQNSGQAHARNVGLKRAEGDVVAFLDSDDWLSDDALESVVDVFDAHPLTGCVLFHCVNHYPDHDEPYPMADFSVMSGKEAFRKSLTWSIHGVYAVRRSIHQRYPYDETLRAYGDDNVTRLHYLSSAEVRLATGVYFYRQHASSVTHRISVRRFDYLEANIIMKRELERIGADRDVIAVYENCRWRNVIGLCMFYYLHHRELSKDDARHGLLTIRRAWQSIDVAMLDGRSACHRFGFWPLRFSWPLFRLQERIYFFLRGLVGKNKES